MWQNYRQKKGKERVLQKGKINDACKRASQQASEPTKNLLPC